MTAQRQFSKVNRDHLWRQRRMTVQASRRARASASFSAHARRAAAAAAAPLPTNPYHASRRRAFSRIAAVPHRRLNSQTRQARHALQRCLWRASFDNAFWHLRLPEPQSRRACQVQSHPTSQRQHRARRHSCAVFAQLDRWTHRGCCRTLCRSCEPWKHTHLVAAQLDGSRQHIACLLPWGTYSM